MTMSWKSILRAITKPRQYIKPTCPICKKPLEEFPGSPNLMCAEGHIFGPDMKRVDLINDGEHRGDL